MIWIGYAAVVLFHALPLRFGWVSWKVAGRKWKEILATRESPERFDDLASARPV
jgi:hypothetical protein